MGSERVVPCALLPRWDLIPSSPPTIYHGSLPPQAQACVPQGSELTPTAPTSWPVRSLKEGSPGAENSEFKAEGTVGVGLDVDGGYETI